MSGKPGKCLFIGLFLIIGLLILSQFEGFFTIAPSLSTAFFILLLFLIIYLFAFVRRLKEKTELKHFEAYARYNPEADFLESNLIDVSENNPAESKLAYHAYLLENIQESIMVINLCGDIVYSNNRARKIFAINEGKVNSDELIKSILGLGQEQFLAIHRQVHSGQSWQGENLLYVDGEERVFMHRIDPLKDKLPISAVVIISTDITELVNARSRAEEANIAKSQFLANMSHEIRTPMIGILGAVDLLEQSQLNNKQSSNVDIIRICGEQLLEIINEILDVSKIEIGLVELKQEPCNLQDIFNRTINIIEPILKDKGLTLKVDIDVPMAEKVLVDPRKLRQIIVNILYNAVKFTSQGEIHIEAYIESESDEKSWLKVSIADTGIGIPADQMEKIFDPFTQVDNSTSRIFGGTGLGLYICKQLLELMDGDICLESTEDSGSIFKFQIPLEIISSEETILEEKKEMELDYQDDLALEFCPIKVLLVEDNSLNQKIVMQMLTNYGFEVSVVSNGLQCLRILQENNFDIILMDMQMPVMDGYETTAFVQENQELNHIPIIAMTANAMNGDREKCLACGCTSYIAKPFKAEDLAREIRKHLQKNLTSPKISQTNSQELIAELIPEFLELLANMLNDLEQAITKKESKAIQSISHDIKGTAGMYGFMEISNLAALLEKAARDNNYQIIRVLTAELSALSRAVNSQVS